MLLLKITLVLFLIALQGFLIWFLGYFLLGPLILKGIFDADLDDIKEKRKQEECTKMDFDKWYDIYCLNTKNGVWVVFRIAELVNIITCMEM